MVAFTKKTPRIVKKVQGVDLQFPAPYAAGHALTENEASALNGLLGENIRNNLAKRVQEAVDKAKEAGTPLDVAALQAELDKYAEGYEFGTSRVTDPVVKVARELAEKTIKAKAEAKSRKLTADELKDLIEQYIAQDAMMQAAEAEYQRRKAAAEAVDSLDIDI